MDNMLYIVAGLVIVLLIAVLIMRRQKAQPPTRSTVNIANTRAKRSLANSEAAIADSTSGATKFDSLTVAERFMNQQRYDKAIETLERGLIQKPHDNSLSFKLLNLYAITNQTDHFYRTYDAISTHGDAATIAQANELKSLLDQEHSQTTQILARNETDSAVDGFAANAEGYDALDFDVATLAGEAQNRPQNNVHAAIQQTATDVDLSSTDLDRSSTAALDRSNSIDEQDFSAEALTNDTLAIHERVDNNFDLTLDDLENETLESEADEFNIFAADDFDDKDVNHHMVEHSFNEPSIDNAHLNSNDFLTLEDQPDNELLALDNAPLAFKADDSFTELENISEDFSLNFDEPTVASSSSTVDANKLAFKQTDNQASSKADINFEDDFVLDFDDLAADSSFDTTAYSSALANNGTEIAPSSSGFGFELTLEDDQVTLDLAAKYLELGEYDSAKRLLSEVLIQGNSEQQIQAQELLQRTA